MSKFDCRGELRVIQKPHGKLFMEKVPGFGWVLSSIVVEAGYRNQGIGSAIMREALEKCGRPVFLFATPELGGELKRLKRFYKRFGFEPCRENKKDLFPYRYNMIKER